MFERIAQLYLSACDKLMEKAGYIPEYRCSKVFGEPGVPDWQNVGHIGSACVFIFGPKTRKYCDLGRFQQAYKIITEAEQQGRKKVNLPWDGFFSLNRLQIEAHVSNRKCLLTEMELDLDYETVPDVFRLEDNPQI